MEFTNEQVKIFIISAIIGSIIYMLIYSKKGQNKSVSGYFLALMHCFSLAVISIFIIIGNWLIKVCLTQLVYVGLIIPIGWFFIAYNLIKQILNNDFGLNIHMINPKSKFWNKITQNKIVIPNILVFIGFAFATFMILFKALPDTANQPYGPVPVLIAGLIFLCATIGLGVLLYLNITNKIAFVPNNENSFTDNATYKIVHKTKNKKSKRCSDEPPIILLGIFLLVGILMLVLGIKVNNSYKEKSENYIETQGKYIGAQLYSTDSESGSTYSLNYSYEVKGETYTVTTDYGTSFTPQYGSEKTILYNPDHPEEAIIKGNNSSILLFILAIFFIGIPGLILGANIVKKIKSNTVRNILEMIGTILIGILFIGVAGIIYYLMCAGTNDFSIRTAIRSAGFLIIFPIIFAGAGVMIIGSVIYLEIKELIQMSKQGHF